MPCKGRVDQKRKGKKSRLFCSKVLNSFCLVLSHPHPCACPSAPRKQASLAHPAPEHHMRDLAALAPEVKTENKLSPGIQTLYKCLMGLH